MGVTAIELNTTKVIKEFNVGDKINTDGLIINATRDDGVVAVLGVDKCEVKCSGEAGESVPVTISFQGIEESYNVGFSYRLRIYRRRKNLSSELQ